MDAAAPVPEFALDSRERMKKSGAIFAEAPHFVMTVARCLRRDRRLLGDIPVDADDMDARQRRALGFQALGDFFTRMARVAQDCYIEDQSAVIEEAMVAVRWVRADAAKPRCGPAERQRAVAMGPAEEVLRVRQERKRRAAQRHERAVETPAAPEKIAARGPAVDFACQSCAKIGSGISRQTQARPPAAGRPDGPPGPRKWSMRRQV